MTQEQWERLKQIFSEALERPAAEREAFVREAAGVDAEELAELLRLLKENDRDTELLSRPALMGANRDDGPQYPADTVLGKRFRIVRFIARGGMGEVYEAEDLELGERVAVKAIRRRVAPGDQLLALFRREIQLARRVTHPNVCRIFDLVQDEQPGGASTILLSMELLEGQTLSDYLDQHGPLPFREALPLIEEIAAGLQAVHDAGIIHGDLKPGNVMLASRTGEARPRPVVMDFGLAHPVTADGADAVLVRGRTPDYSAPEQAQGAPLTTATDVYCLGLVIEDMLGVPHPERLKPDAERMPFRWARLLRRCLATDPARRYAKPSELARALRASANPLPRQARIAAAALLCVAAGIGATLWINGDEQSGPSTRQLFRESESIQVWGIAPDGSSLAITDWDTGDLVLRDVRTGKLRRLTHRQVQNHVYAGGVYHARFSPDGRRILYQWGTSRSDSELRVIGSDGTGERTVYPHSRCIPLEWSPDGERILVLERAAAGDTTEQLRSVSLSDGSAQTIQMPGGTDLSKVRFTPDGAGLVYEVESGSAVEIHELSRSGGDTTLVGRPGSNRLIGWSPDRRRLIFSSDRRGRRGVWEVPVGAGGPAGEARELVPDAREWRALGITRSGVLFYEEDADATNVYTAVLDLAGARTVSPPKPVLERPLLSCTNPSWSEDGSRLVFTASASTEPEGPFLIIYVPGTGSTREFRPSLKMLRRPQWSEHDAAIMAPATDSGGTAGTFRIDAVTGEPKLMRTAKELETGFEGVWTKDGKTLFNRYTVWQRGIFRMNMASGERKVLYVPPAGVDIGTENLALSPDGSTLAFHARNDAQGTGTLMLMPAEGGQPQALLTIHKPESFVFGSFAWVPDGRSILCSRTREAGSEIWRVPVDGSTPTRIEFPLVRVANLRLNRDGKTIAFMNSSLRSEIWVLRNFL